MTARQAVRLATLTLTAAPPRRRVERLLLLDTRAGRIDRLAAPGRSVIGPIAPVVASVEHSVIAPIALDREAADPPPPAAGTAPPQRIAPVQNVARSGIVRVVRTVVSVGRSVTAASVRRRVIVRSVLRLVGVLRSVTGRIVRVVRTVVSVGRSVTAASVRRRVIVRSVLRLVGVLRSVTGRIVRVVRTVVSVGRSVTAASVPLETTVASVGSTTAVLSVQPRATVRSGRRPVSVVRSVIARIDLLPAIGRPAPTVVPRATVRIAPGVRRQTTAGPRRVTVGRRVTVRSVLRVATVPIAAPEQPDALRATAASVRTRRAAASGPRRGSVSARSALHRTVGHGTSVRRARSARRAKTSGQVGRRSQTASPPPRSPRMCCSRIWTVRYGRGCAR
jgi:hypothetical protein